MYEVMVQRELCRRMYMYEARSPTLGRLQNIRRSRHGSCKRRKRTVQGSLRRTNTYRMADGGVQHSGYIDIKQPPKVKGRKLKSWKKKWVVLQEIEIRSAGDKSAAKVDVYADEKTAMTSPTDKQTFILEYVTDIRAAKSKTRDHAFEIVENEAVLLLSGATELETQTWIAAFRKIFWPAQAGHDVFAVEILPNEHTRRLGLHAVYQMTVNPEVVAIHSEEHNSYEWSLSMLKRFHVDRSPLNPNVEGLVIECGPKSECGEAEFIFIADSVSKILESIKKNIYIAINSKKNDQKQKSNFPSKEGNSRGSFSSNQGIDVNRSRSETCSSTEQRYRDLLENTCAGSNSQTPPSGVERMTSVKSESSGDFSEEALPEVPKKKRQSVTFDTPGTDKQSCEILEKQVEICDDGSSEYNKVEFNTTAFSVPCSIVSTVTVATPGYTTKLFLDDKGYSHVDMKDSKPFVIDNVDDNGDKVRTLSNISSVSSNSCRSTSVGSRDSGIMYAKIDKSGSQTSQSYVPSHRSTNSFDSAVSTSSTMEQTEVTSLTSLTPTSTQLTVEIQEIEVQAHDLSGDEENDIISEDLDNFNPVYQDVSIEETDVKPQPKEALYSKAGIKKSSSTGNCKSIENEYEDLDTYRKGKKNLIKHLGMDPFVDPKSVPPSLPERPSSHRLRRKAYNNDKKLFTLPFRSKKKMRERAASISSSSSGGSEEGANKKANDLAVKAWPLGNKSVIVGNDDLYQPVAIERFLKDNDGVMGPQKRERSCSLNLNTANLTMKRPSICSTRDMSGTDRNNALWKHNRNVSMQMDMLNRMHDPDTTMLNTGMLHKFDTSLHPDLLERERRLSHNLDLMSNADRTLDELEDHAIEDEPIYAELEPTKRESDSSIGETNNPFPNLTVWKPADISDVAEVSELNATQYENDDSFDSINKEKGGDLFNQGFVVEEENKENRNKSINSSVTMSSADNLLIDLSDADNKTSFGVDIFNMGTGPSYFNPTPVFTSQGVTFSSDKSADFVDIFNLGVGNVLTPNTCNGGSVVSTHAQHELENGSGNQTAGHESIYMDMSSCKNESIYVLPSTLKAPEHK